MLRSTPSQAYGVNFLTVHYTGAGSVSVSEDQVAGYIKNIERQDFANTSQGYSAIKYNFFADKFGRLWEGRGFDYRNAADGGGANRDSISVQVMVGVNDNRPTEQMVFALQSLYQHAVQRYGRLLGVRCHKDVRSTSCPGVELEALVRSGRISQPVSALQEVIGQRVDVPQLLKEASMFKVTSPTRVYDSRDGGKRVRGGSSVVVRTNLPADAKAAHVNITGLFNAAGFLTVWADGARPNASVLNGKKDDVVANAVTVPLRADRTFQVFAQADTHVVVDVMGYHA